MKIFYNTFNVFIFLIVLIISLSSCATLLKNSSEEVEFSSDPTGTEVYVNGNLRGTTPVKIRLKSKSTHTIEYKKEGYPRSH